MKTKSIIQIAALVMSVALLALAAPAAAKPAPYSGETEAGTPISFTRTGNAVSRLQAEIPVMCVSTRTSDSRAGTESFTPPGRIRIGGEWSGAAELPVAMGMGDTATKNFHVTLKRGRRGAISGKLELNFMAVEPYYNSMGYLDANTFVCQGATKFRARPR